MHRAPAVNFPVRRSRRQAGLIVCVSLLAAASLAVFVWEQNALDLRTAIFGMTIVVVGSIALFGWRHAPQGNLRWTGEHWYWSGFPERAVCSLALLMDLQSVVLVKVTADTHAPVYLWLEAAPGEANWRAVRRAIVSSQAASSDGKRAKTGTGVVGDLA